jgi:hypothetical protein
MKLKSMLGTDFAMYVLHVVNHPDTLITKKIRSIKGGKK